MKFKGLNKILFSIISSSGYKKVLSPPIQIMELAPTTYYYLFFFFFEADVGCVLLFFLA